VFGRQRQKQEGQQRHQFKVTNKYVFKCRLKVDIEYDDVTNDGKLFHTWQQRPGKCDPWSISCCIVQSSVMQWIQHPVWQSPLFFSGWLNCAVRWKSSGVNQRLLYQWKELFTARRSYRQRWNSFHQWGIRTVCFSFSCLLPHSSLPLNVCRTRRSAIGDRPSLLLRPVLQTTCPNMSRPYPPCLFSKVASRLSSSGVSFPWLPATFVVPAHRQLSFSDTHIVLFAYLLTYLVIELSIMECCSLFKDLRLICLVYCTVLVICAVDDMHFGFI